MCPLPEVSSCSLLARTTSYIYAETNHGPEEDANDTVSVTFGPLLPCGTWCCFYKSPVLQLLSTDSGPVYSCLPWANSKGGCDRGAKVAKPILMPHSTKDGKTASGCWWVVYPSGSAGSSFILNPISLRVLRPTATGHICGLGTGRGVC